MKIINLVLAGVVLTSLMNAKKGVAASDVPNVKLECRGVCNIYGDKFGDLRALKSMKIETGDAERKNGETVLELGEGGDQHQFISFRNDDLLSVSSGRAKVIRGIYEDGFDWSNGYNVRSRVVLECTHTGLSVVVASTSRADQIDLNCASPSDNLKIIADGQKAYLPAGVFYASGAPGCYEIYGIGCGTLTTFCVDPDLITGKATQGKATLTDNGNYGCGGWTEAFTCRSE